MVLRLDSSSSSPPEAPGVAGHFLSDVVIIVSETLETDCYVSTFLQLLSVVCSTTHCSLLTVMSVILGNYIICHIFTKDIGWGDMIGGYWKI